MTRKKPPSYRTKHRLNKKYLLYTGGIYMCFYCRSYIVNKTFSKYNSKSTNNFSFRNELNDIILQKLTVLSFKTIPIILVILRKTIIFAHSDA